MKKQITIALFAALFLVIGISMQSCRKDFDINEFDNTTTDSLDFEGSIAIPLIDTEFTLMDFAPDGDSSLWTEVDDEGLVHLRMYYKEVLDLSMNEIYTTILYPTPPGTLILASEKTLATDTSKMKVYNKMLSGHLFFRDPRITFKISNEIPVVTFFTLDTLIFYNLEGEALSHTSDKKYTITAPTLSGTSAETEIFIDKTEIPILPDVFSPVPRSISFVVTAGSDGNQTLPYLTLGTEKFNLDVDVDLPLDARLEDLAMGDTVPYPFKEGDNTYEQVTSLTLKIRFNNGFPVEGMSQIYFADTTNTGEIGNLIDSAFTDITAEDIFVDGWRFQSAETDAIGTVTFPQESNIVITLDQERLQHFKDSHVSKIIIVSKLNSYESHTGLNIKILSHYKLGVKIAVKADFSVSSNDNL